MWLLLRFGTGAIQLLLLLVALRRLHLILIGEGVQLEAVQST